MIESLLAAIGRPFLKSFQLIENFGTFFIFMVNVLKSTPELFKRPKELMRQLDTIGFGTVGVITLTAVFTGLVQAIQLYQGFHEFGVESYMGYTIFLATTKELGPVFATLMVISRSISAMAAELGTMRVSEQIDAIEILGVDSKGYLIIPRIVATFISLPILTLWFDFVAISSAFIISDNVLHVNTTLYQENIMMLGKLSDILTGLIKAGVFGLIISAIGTYVGYHTSGGARGVGQSTIYAVVYSAVALFIANYFLSSLFLFLDI